MTVAVEAAQARRHVRTAHPAQVDADGTSVASVRSHRAPQVLERDTHLLRLSLDLQLDALLLVLGASAAGRPDDAMPWRRWLSEDVDLAWELTTTALSVRGDVPPSLGADLATADPAQLTENLLARYSSMCSLLEDLLPSQTGVVDLRGPDGSDRSAWYDQVRVALDRYRARVEELKAYRASTNPSHDPSAHEPEPGAPSGHLSGRSYLPGELLG